jgi:deaminated glutathione amidase
MACRAMSRLLRVACVQLNTRDDVAANVAAATALVEEAVAAGARLVALPETWAYKGLLPASTSRPKRSTGRATPHSRRRPLGTVSGCWPARTTRRSRDPGRVYNTSVLFGPGGDVRAVYRKIHLFDAVSGRRSIGRATTCWPASHS